MLKVFSGDAWEDYLYWQRHDRRILRRINTLIRETERSPFAGIGKLEPLKHHLAGWWSRRIDDKHRMVYRIREENGKRLIGLASLRFHYG